MFSLLSQWPLVFLKLMNLKLIFKATEIYSVAGEATCNRRVVSVNVSTLSAHKQVLMRMTVVLLSLPSGSLVSGGFFRPR